MSLITLAAAASTSRPPIPTRQQLLRGRSLLQGCAVQTGQYGNFRSFAPELSMLDRPSDRANYVRARRAKGETIVHMGLAGATYSEPDFTFAVPGPYDRWINDLDGFCARCDEVVNLGQYDGLLVSLPGDGFTTPDYAYGYERTMAILPAVSAALHRYAGGALLQRLILLSGFDGVVWTWSEAQILAYGQLVRALFPDTVISALEFPAGVLGPFGEGRDQFDHQMQIFDLFLQEYSCRPRDNPNQIWQINARFAGPWYRRGPDQPADDDPGAPFPTSILSGGTPRGAYGWWYWEGDTFSDVRGHLTDADVDADGAYIGATCLQPNAPYGTGWPAVSGVV